MLRIHELLYVDDDIREKIKEVREVIENDKIFFGLYYITLSSNKCEQLDILSGYMLYNEKKFIDETVIVGIAKNKKSALELVACMATDLFKATGNCDFRKMFV